MGVWRRIRKAVKRGLYRYDDAQVKDDEYRDLMAMTLGEWVGKHHVETVFKKVSWMGVETLKMVTDIWIYQELIFRTRPEVLVEIGSYKGGSTLFFAQLYDMLAADHGMDGKVVSIDIDRSVYEVSHPRITELTGDNLSPEIFERVRALCEGKRTMVMHDGDHKRDNVYESLKLYGPLVSPGCYFVVEDGIQDVFARPHPLGDRNPGPLVATRDFLRENDDFEIDEDCERYGITYNPRGYLRRKGG